MLPTKLLDLGSQDDFGAFWMRGQALKSQGEYEKAVADFDRAIELGPEAVQAYRYRGDAKFSLKQFAEARIDYEQAIKFVPKHAGTLNMLGRTLNIAGEQERAVETFDEALRINPNYGWPYFNRGIVRKERGEYALAIADYEKSIELFEKQKSSNAASPLNNLSWLLAVCPDSTYRDGDKAIEYGEKACELTDWKSPNKIGTLAAAYAEAGNFEKAIELETRAIDEADEAYDVESGKQRLAMFKDGKPYHVEE